MTVTGTILPSSVKRCVMPTFRPSIPGSILRQTPCEPDTHRRTRARNFDSLALSFFCLIDAFGIPLPEIRGGAHWAGSHASDLFPDRVGIVPVNLRNVKAICVQIPAYSRIPMVPLFLAVLLSQIEVRTSYDANRKV